MTDQRELDRLLGAYLLEGTNELADRVIDAALDQIDHTQQRHRWRVPWRFQTMTMPVRLAAAALIGVLAVGGTLYVLNPGRPSTDAAAAPSSPVAAPTATATAAASAAVSASPAAAFRTTGAPTDDHGSNGVAVGLIDGRVLVAGGGSGPVLTRAELYDPASGRWSATGSMHHGRSYPIAVRLTGGKVLVAGGDDGLQSLGSAELFDPVTGVWTPTGSMTGPRSQAFGALLSDGRVLVAGGGTNSGLSATAELYDPATGRWTPTGSMTAGRAGPLSATRLRDGRVLVTGGFADDGTSTEIYDPATGKWTAAAHLQVAPGDGSAILLADGRVLVSGGDTPTSSEIFDPATATWTSTSEMAASTNDRVVLTDLTDGNVLLVLGASLGGPYTGSGEIFHPATRAWSSIGQLAASRFVRSATPLSNGQVLVVGSTMADAGGPATAELYDSTP